MQRLELEEWCESKARFWDKAVKGSSALQAALDALVRDEVAQEEGLNRLSLFWDLEKFYDTIALHKLIQAGREFEYPAELLLLALRCYLGPRLIVWMGTAGDWMFPNTSICAGCIQANNMARMTMYVVLDKMHVMHPQVELSQFVDDVKMAEEGVCKYVVAWELAQVGVDFRKECREMMLKISDGKSGAVASSLEVGKEFQKALRRKYAGIQVKEEMRYLGGDSTGAKKRSVKAAKERESAADKRQRRVGTIGLDRVKSRTWKTAAWAKGTTTCP